METKTKLADEPSRTGTGNSSSRQSSVPLMKRSHWIIFIAICFILGLLVFATIIHVIETTPSRARLLHTAAPVETVPVRRQDLNEIIGGRFARRSSASTTFFLAPRENLLAHCPNLLRPGPRWNFNSPEPVVSSIAYRLPAAGIDLASPVDLKDPARVVLFLQPRRVLAKCFARRQQEIARPASGLMLSHYLVSTICLPPPIKFPLIMPSRHSNLNYGNKN